MTPRARQAGWAALGLAAVATAILLAALWLRPGPGEPGTWIGPAEAQRLSAAGALTIVDVRSPDEWRETGIPAGAETVTIHGPRGMAGFLDGVLAATGGDRDAPLATICAAGARSSRARAYLVEHGFTNVRDVTAGMLGRPGHPGWIERGLPVEACENC